MSRRALPEDLLERHAIRHLFLFNILFYAKLFRWSIKLHGSSVIFCQYIFWHTKNSASYIKVPCGSCNIENLYRIQIPIIFIRNIQKPHSQNHAPNKNRRKGYNDIWPFSKQPRTSCVCHSFTKVKAKGWICACEQSYKYPMYCFMENYIHEQAYCHCTYTKQYSPRFHVKRRYKRVIQYSVNNHHNHRDNRP